MELQENEKSRWLERESSRNLKNQNFEETNEQKHKTTPRSSTSLVTTNNSWWVSWLMQVIQFLSSMYSLQLQISENLVHIPYIYLVSGLLYHRWLNLSNSPRIWALNGFMRHGVWALVVRSLVLYVWLWITNSGRSLQVSFDIADRRGGKFAKRQRT